MRHANQFSSSTQKQADASAICSLLQIYCNQLQITGSAVMFPSYGNCSKSSEAIVDLNLTFVSCRNYHCSNVIIEHLGQAVKLQF